MKTLSLKVLGCAAAMSLLTITRAQTSDDAQAVPPPDTSAQQSTDTGAPAQQGQQMAPVIVMPVQNNNGGDANVEQQDNGQNANGQNAQPDNGNGTIVIRSLQSAQPGQFQSNQMQQGQPNQYQPNQYRNGGNQYQNGGGQFNNGQNQLNNRGFRNRGFNGGQSFGGQQQRFNTGAGDANMFMPPTTGGTNGTDGLIFNFRGVPIEQVLNYPSDAAGFIIQVETHVNGTIDVWSSHPVSREEAVQLLNTALNNNGYAAVQSGRVLRIMNRDDAIHSQIPVIVGNDPDQIPQTDQMVTQIIPIRYVSARQLISDLSLLTPSHAIVMANDAGNSIIVTDTQENIHHLVELVKAIDSSAEDVTEVKPFQLHYHDPVEVANLITQVFADQSGQSGGQAAPVRFGGFGGPGGFANFFGGGRRGGFGGQGGQGGGQGANPTDRIRQHAKVVAVADQRTQSVIVTAPKDLMAQVEELVTQIDRDSPKVAKVSVIHLENADPQEVQKALQAFANSNSRTTGSQQNSALMTRALQASGSSSSSGFGTSSSGFGGGNSGFGGGGGGGFGGGGGGGFGGGRGGFGQ